jgi:flagellar hook-associated protein 2
VVGISSMNLIDVQAIVSNIMAIETMRGSRLVEQKSAQDAQIVAYQEINASMAAVATAAEAITSSARWVPASTSVTFSNSGADTGKVSAYSSAGAVSGNSPYPFTVTSIVDSGTGSTTATLQYTKNSSTVTQTSTSNTFSNLADFPGLTITVSGTMEIGPPPDTVTLAPSATSATTSTVLETAAQNLVTALNNTLNLIKVQTSASGALETDFTPQQVSQSLISTVFNSNTLATLNDSGIRLTKVGSFTFDASAFSEAYASNGPSIIGQVAAFASRVELVATAEISVTGSLSREISTRQTRVFDLTQQILDMNAALVQRENSLTVFYSELNAKIQTLQSKQNYLQTSLDVFVKALTAN